MNTSRVKDLIILLLAMVNIFLGIMLAVDYIESSVSRHNAQEALVEIFRENEIELSDEALGKAWDMDTAELRAGLDIKDWDIEAILGEYTVGDQGGGLLFYDGEKGDATSGVTGSFQMLLEGYELGRNEDPVSAALDFTERLGIEARLQYEDIDGQSGTVSLRAYGDGAEFLNCNITIYFASGNLYLVTGMRPLPDLGVNIAEESLNLPSVLLRFLDIIKSEGYVCKRIDDVSLCYLQNSSITGANSLEPVWKLSTDVGVFYVNGLTGKIETF